MLGTKELEQVGESLLIMHQGVENDAIDVVARVSLVVDGAQVRSDLEAVLDAPDRPGEGPAPVREANPELRQALEEPAVKERLRSEVNAAIERGVFGSPYIVIDGEPFWGVDRLEQVDRWLATGGW